ncbi:hypothetical protein QAD02_002264 [Eretmocerus hayati]|uniref:Uncharacterized protein n=1 Tax=Eretmocerus hayati TaxID=131215 RepID=A0ACC2NIE3_9HYME|nr:hypothetical protein QAD02_002264 [Eretmocerus hayati]
MPSTGRGSLSPSLQDMEQEQDERNGQSSTAHDSEVSSGETPTLGEHGTSRDPGTSTDEQPQCVNKWALVAFVEENRGKERLRVNTENLHGFYDDIPTKEPIFMRNVVVDSEFVKEGWVRVLLKSETPEGLDSGKRIPVEKINDSSLEYAISQKTEMMDPKNIKKEKVEAMIHARDIKKEKVEAITKKKTETKESKPKKSKKSDEPNINAAATAQLNNELLGIACLGLESLSDGEQDGGGTEGIATKVAETDLLRRIEELEKVNSALVKKVQDQQDEPKKTTITSMPIVQERLCQNVDASNSSDSTTSQPCGGATANDSVEIVTVKQTCARVPARRRSSTSSLPPSKRKKVETTLEIPKHCNKDLYENDMAFLQEIEFEIDGKKVWLNRVYQLSP